MSAAAGAQPGQRTLLVVEDDPDTASLLAMYFQGLGYTVDVSARGQDAVALARKRLPHLVLLDIGLPDLDGYTVCDRLRASPRTGHIPIIILSEKDSLDERLTGLGRGAQDYVTKPFDLEELRLRVHNLIARTAHDNQVDPRTGLPTGAWVERHRRQTSGGGWSTVEFQLEGFQPFVDVNGFVAGDDVLALAARLLREAVDECGTPDDFIGHPANDVFLIITAAADPGALAARAAERFNEAVLAHYSFLDREQGFLLIRGHDGAETRAPLMALTVSRTEWRQA